MVEDCALLHLFLHRKEFSRGCKEEGVGMELYEFSSGA